MARGRSNDDERARKTLYVTGFSPKLITKPLLLELFNQGGPVADITLFETHAYVLFQHEVSVPYCLALFNEIELHGNKLRLSPRARTKDTYSCIDYLTKIRDKIRDDYMRIDPPQLPPKIYPNDEQHPSPSKSCAKRKNKFSLPGAKRRKNVDNNITQMSKGRASNKQAIHMRAKRSGKINKAGSKRKTKNYRMK